MNKTEFFNNLSRTFNKVGFKIQKHSPEILLVTGTVGVIASTVMACKATTKVNFVLEETRDNVETIHKALERGTVKTEELDADGKNVEIVYTGEDHKKDLAIVYGKTGLKLVKLYGPAVLLGAASLGCFLTSHKIMRGRNMAFAAAYATVDRGFKEYRERLIERFGKDVDRELKYNIKAKEIEEIVMQEDGTETTVTKTVEVVDPNVESDYARFFDEWCTGWTKDAESNLIFLKQQQNQANDMLRAKGRLFLNEVYDMLGIPRSKAGQIVGWVYDKDNQIGDNYVDFGIYDLHNEQKRLFVNGHERSILLDFNVDGNIWELMR